MKVAITGGIGSGKSYVCRMLAEQGIEVYDCDHAAKVLMNSSAALRQQLTQLIGYNAYLPDGRLNKAVVAQFLLKSDANKTAINNVVHPAVAADF
ncbi:MAG: dephospho-CoA kinase, partial [Prevotella sp.]|nr:dephospho-CoA kinase [Prevotella sp.]